MRVSIVNSVCRARDAIGEAVHETYRAIVARPGWECQLFTYASDFTDVQTCPVTGTIDVVQDPFFASSDVHLFHFGFYSPLFTLLGAGTSHTKRVVRFHNVTPKALVPAEIRPLIDRSYDQIALMDEADEIWADSPYNRSDLIEYGISAKRILVEPLFGKQQYSFSGRKPSGRVNMLYVGRFVESKGVLDLIEAADRVRKLTTTSIHIDLVGSLTFSNSIYVETVRARIEALKLGDVVTFAGEISDVELTRYYHDAHIVVIPSYHEGFCVPLVEALHARAIPVAYGAGNIPFLLDGVGEIIPTGNTVALAAGLVRLANWYRAGWDGDSGPLPLCGTLVEAKEYAARITRHANLYSVGEFRRRVVERLSIVTNRWM